MSYYFVCTYGNFEGREDIIKKSLEEKCYQLHIEANYPSAMNKIKAKDVLLLKDGCFIIAYGEADGAKTYRENNGWNHIVQVECWNKLDVPVHSYGISWHTVVGGSMSLVKQVDSAWALEKIPRLPEYAEDENEPPVAICSISLKSLLKKELCIPEYQRGYCWHIRNVHDLLDDIVKWQSTHTGSDDIYHLGTIILRAAGNDTFEIIDGQQRLTTLAIWQYLKIDGNNPPSLLNSTLSCNNLTHEVKQAILRAQDTIKGYNEDINFEKIILSVVVIDNGQPQDLAYTFFSNSNSTGKRLSDYDLLKTHHLRYIEGETVARKMVERWHSLEKSGKQDELLHQTMFRLRNWRSGTPFRLNASNTPERDIFRHYAVNLDSLKGFSAFPSQPFRFDSILGGGDEFFRYVECYRKRYADFAQLEVVKKLYDFLGWHSNGVLHAGIRAIAFLFYCKFGDLYLNPESRPMPILLRDYAKACQQ